MPRVLSEEESLDHEAMLKASGYCIVEALLDGVETAAMAAALQPLQADTPYGDNDFTGVKTRRVFNLAAKTRALDQAILNPDVLRLIRAALGASIQVSILSTMEIFPGETPQALHQDDRANSRGRLRSN